MYLMIYKFFDEEIRQIVAWVIHRESADNEELYGEFTNFQSD